jgi:ribosomal protein S1
VWIKELDREKNRISLSMVQPGTMTLRDLEEGSTVRGKVTRLERYGAFVDIGVGRDGMLHVKEMGRGYVEKPEDVVHIGDEIDVQVIGLDRRRGRIDLSIKELLPPAPEQVPTAASAYGARPQDEDVPAMVEEQFLSPFEAAFQQAQGDPDASRRRDRKKKTRTWDFEEDEEEDLIQRTIAHHRRSKGQ